MRRSSISGHKMSGHEPEPERSCASSSIDELLENSAAYVILSIGTNAAVALQQASRTVAGMSENIGIFCT